MLGGWAHFAQEDFGPPLASASSGGAVTGLTVCANGSIAMTNTVTAPVVSGTPSEILSGDTRIFTATWSNTTAGSITLPLEYAYYVGQAGPQTQASWTCATSGGGTCPAWGTGSATIDHTSPVDQAVTVFSGSHTLLAGQTLTFTVRLATTVSICSEDGALRVQSYARFGTGYTPPANTRTSAPSQAVDIRCSTWWLLDEDFSGTSVTDPAWKGLTDACLTRATTTQPNGLGTCDGKRVRVPSTTFTIDGQPRGFLKLTDDDNNKVGAALYDRAMPSKSGLILQFTQYQYGDQAGQADGIGFFLADGAYSLTAHGERGGALGYAYTTGDVGANGVPHGYLGVGFDVYGNYGNTNFVANECTLEENNGISTNVLVPQAVSLRGPGEGRTGYCLVGTQTMAGLNPAYTLNAQLASSTPTEAQLRTTLQASERRTRVTVHPLEDGETKPRVTVEIDFGQGYFTLVLDKQMDSPAPELIKFGFLGSTGGSRGTHMLNSVRVGTVLPLKDFDMVKSVDHREGTGTDKTSFDLGDTIPYQFVVSNSSEVAVHDLLVTDPLLGTVTCPTTTIPSGGQVICTGSYVVTAADRTAGIVYNTATAYAATVEDHPRNLTSTDSATAPVNPTADDATRTIAPGGTATFQVLKHGATLGLVAPDDPSKITITLRVPPGGTLNMDGSITVAGQGTWTIDANNTVVFTPINGTYAGTVTPLVYDATNAYGGTDSGTLSVVISTLPYLECTAAERRASDRYWSFGANALFNFGVSGTGTPAIQTLANVGGGRGVFTVTDSTGLLQFSVDGGTTNGSRIVNRNGALMAGNSTLNTTATGGQQVVAFPAGQGTGKYFVVTSSASNAAAGSLYLYTVDMTLNGGLGGVTANGVIASTTNASMALTAVPNADGTGYWVLNPAKTGNGIRALRFNASGYAGSMVTSTVGTQAIGSVAANTYEDIRFSSDFTSVAALATKGTTTFATDSNQIRLMNFNAATGALTLRAQVSLSGTNSHGNGGWGFNLEFSPNGEYLYVSRLPRTTNSAAGRGNVYRYTVGATSLTGGAQVGTSGTNNTSGMIRLGPDGRLYWLRNGSTVIRYLPTPNTTGTTWTTLSPTVGSNTGYGLPQTLADCAIPPSSFKIQKLDSEGAAIAGATFVLYPDNGGVAGPTPVSPGVVAGVGTGAFDVSGLAPGSYWLRETQAPAGHQLLTQDILVNVGLRNEVTIDLYVHSQTALTLNPTTGIYTVSVTNIRGKALPLAGGTGTSWLLWGGGALFVAALGGAAWWRRRRGGPGGADPPPGHDPTAGGGAL